MRTYSVRASEIRREWWVIDGSGKTLGRLATEIAVLLQGKGKPMYSSHLDVGDYVVLTNADRVHVTGKKAKEKLYYRHTSYPGGLKKETLGEVLEAHPTRVIEHAVKGMLPHNPRGRAMFKRFKVYAGDTHPHQAQVQSQGRQ